MVIKRIKPCENCKKRRRKCDQPPGKDSCLRCARLSLDCIYNTKTTRSSISSSCSPIASSALLADPAEMAEVDGSEELHHLRYNVRTLEREMQQLETKLGYERQLNRSTQHALTTKDATTCLTIPKTWNFTITNGHLRLETGIHTLSDLLQYRQTTLPIRYLTPFNNKAPLRFRLEQGSLLTKAVDLLAKHGLLSDSCPSSISSIPWTSHPLPPDLLVDTLVQQYFRCYNSTLPLVHEPTFRAHYNPADPNVVTLAICCFMSVSYCCHLPFTAYQKRTYGEYFYLACRAQLDDLLLDNPHLEVVVAMHFLYKFMALTLRIKDIRRLATVGFLAAIELKRQAPGFGPIEKELVNRHMIMAAIVFALTEFICVQRMDDIVPSVIQFQVLPGESAKAGAMLAMYKYLFGLALHHDCIVMVQELRRVTIGQVGQVSLEAMIRFDKLCRDWWASLPEQWRYCEDPYGARHAIDHCDNDIALIAHSFLLTVTLGVHSALMNPQNLNDQTSHSIQGKAMVMTLNCCDLLLVVADRLKAITTQCGFYCECLLRVFDALRSLLVHARNANNSQMVAMATGHMHRCLAELDTSVVSELGDRPLSPVPKTSPVYTDFPLPGNALMFDLINASVKSIGMVIP